MAQPPDDFLADVYRNVPFLVVHLSVDGVILHCNPATLQITGYAERELVGRNFWGLLFPGKLFAQVPKFVSSLAGGDGRDPGKPPLTASTPAPHLPVTIRAKDGRERVLALSKYVHIAGGRGGQGEKSGGLAQKAADRALDDGDSAPRSLLCVGIDLTDRLIDAERDQLPSVDLAAGLMAFGPHIGNAGSIDGEFVTPLAISPPPLPGGTIGISASLGTTRGGPIEQTFECLARLDSSMMALRDVIATGTLHTLTALAETLRDGPARAFAFAAAGNALHIDETRQWLTHLQVRADEVVQLYRKERL